MFVQEGFILKTASKAVLQAFIENAEFLYIGIYGKGRETARLNEIPDARHIVLSIDSLVILPHV